MTLDHTVTADSAASSPKQQLVSYLHETLEQSGGDCYIKSKYIADEIDLSATEIGSLLGRLRESATDLRIEKWAYSSATTWYVSRR